MIIFLVIGGKAAGVKGSNIYCDNVYNSLLTSGHEIILYQFEKEFEKSGISDYNKSKEFWTNDIKKKFFDNNNKRHIDLFFSFIDSTVVEIELIKEISKSTYTINYTTNFHQFYLIEEISKYFHLTTYISLDAKKTFDQNEIKSYWMPMAANPSIYLPSKVKNSIVSFVGTSYGNRPYYLWRALQMGIEIDIYGPFWKQKSKFDRLLRNFVEPILYSFGDNKQKLNFLSRNTRRIIIETLNNEFKDKIHNELSDDEMVKVLAESEIIINFPESRYNHDYLNPNMLLGCNLRDFEVPMAGSLLFTQNNKELSYFYEVGTEVVAFENEYDLIDKIKYYTTNLNESREIARKGHLRAIKEHTWEKRFEKLFREIDIIQQ